MALMKSKELPKDAITVSEVEAISYVWDIVSNWESLWDKWALIYAPAVLGSISGISGVVVNNYYRKKLKLGKLGHFSSIVPITVMPGLFSALFHRHLVSSDILLMKSHCPICLEMRSAVIQCGFGTVYPMILGPTSALMFANRYGTYRVPHLGEGLKVMYQFIKKITQPFNSTLVYIAALQLIASSVMTHFEIKNNITLRQKLLEIENSIQNEQS